MTVPASLIDELAAGRLVPFVGSGVSLSLKRGLFPTWAQLLGGMAQQLNREGKQNEGEIVRLFCETGELFDAARQILAWKT